MDVRENQGEIKTRWVRVSTEMLEHEVLCKGPFDRRSAWLWLITNAAWKDRRVNHKGKPIILKRGQVLAGRSYLAETWGWGEQMVRSFLLMLQREHMIELNQSNGHLANIVTICNYGKYQSAEKRDNQEKNQSVTSAQPERNHTLTRDTNIPEPITTLLPRTPRVEKNESQSGRDFWSKVMTAHEPVEHKAVTLGDDGVPVLHNGTRAKWLAKFDGDSERLQLALEQAAGWVQPNSSRPLEAQVSSQLAKTLAEKKDRDQRYERATVKTSSASNGSNVLAFLDSTKGAAQ